MGFKHRHYLSGTKVYSCSVCRTHMATIESMISKRFNGQHGQAYLFDAVFNTLEGEAEDRQMTTGLHRVRDVRCGKCGQTMGWKYERAYEASQKYKEGKTILEKMLLTESNPAHAMHFPSGPIPIASSGSGSGAGEGGHGLSPASASSGSSAGSAGSAASPGSVAQLINANLLSSFGIPPNADFRSSYASAAAREDDNMSAGGSLRSMSAESE